MDVAPHLRAAQSLTSTNPRWKNMPCCALLIPSGRTRSIFWKEHCRMQLVDTVAVHCVSNARWFPLLKLVDTQLQQGWQGIELLSRKPCCNTDRIIVGWRDWACDSFSAREATWSWWRGKGSRATIIAGEGAIFNDRERKWCSDVRFWRAIFNKERKQC